MTVGPFFAYGLAPAAYGKPEPLHNRLALPGVRGARIILCGRVLDRNGAPVDDALIEIWQANASGRYPRRIGKQGFRGHGRCATDEGGWYRFHTVKPGPIAADSAPHVNCIVFARGLLNHLFTRIYFADEAQANAQDAVLQSAGSRRRTLLAVREKHPDGAAYRFDINLSGSGETVFFDL